MSSNSSLPDEMSELASRREEFLASRKAAGRLIDVETCEIWSQFCDLTSPYEWHAGECLCYGSAVFVRSADSNGRVCEYDLPEDKQRALRARIDRAERTPTTPEGVRDVLLEKYACAVAALDGVIDDLVNSRFPNVPVDVVRCGVRLALAKLGKEGTPQHLRLERRLRAELALRAGKASS